MGTYGLWMQTWGDPSAVRTALKARRAHKVTPQEVVSTQIDGVASGQEIVFELGQIYIKPFITILRNPAYPERGRKYIVFQEGRGPDGSPNGRRGRFWDTDKSLSIAKWLLDREGHLYKLPISAATAS